MPLPTTYPFDDATPVTRRRALLAAAAALLIPLTARAQRGGVKHPDPRPGVTADHVLPADQVPESAKEAYDAARAAPELLDGIYCHCDCASRHDNLRSLLSCFETTMPLSCGICQ
ncbi:MAG TPA: hypothetical protein VFQ39_01135, partial [Longimicrobium sp.]|nr:hypothetical protein [Longimicrobium sp.]